ncbi:hypothetical protein JCM19294_1119 [Nonlabens tegetincola]|uniref:HIRAN domain-containing protein n=1 Tax=Nonlabens tegetincola TaxID=323273 RepID=A0A090Q1A0_9FLAO|nr:HIRAN domain-containing protein [Nonlabens tegetincola]GAK96810.1 hypothetical protein JCM19294_1119 [Nonlabens tegetincola]
MLYITFIIVFGLIILLFIIKGSTSKDKHLQAQLDKYIEREGYIVKEVKTLKKDLKKLEAKLKGYQEYEIAGVHISKRKNYILDNCNEGDEITLKPEPNNPVDENAIAIYHESKHIGYVRAIDIDKLKDTVNDIYSAYIEKIEVGYHFTVTFMIKKH